MDSLIDAARSDLERAETAYGALNEITRRGTESMNAGQFDRACAYFLMVLASDILSRARNEVEFCRMKEEMERRG